MILKPIVHKKKEPSPGVASRSRRPVVRPPLLLLLSTSFLTRASRRRVQTKGFVCGFGQKDAKDRQNFRGPAPPRGVQCALPTTLWATPEESPTARVDRPSL